jgi:hypothetical protein
MLSKIVYLKHMSFPGESERHHHHRKQPSCEYVIDGKGYLLYHDPVERKPILLVPAQPITDSHAMIGKIGQQNLLTTHVTLKPKDLEMTVITLADGTPIGAPLPPGISSFLFFGSSDSNQDRLSAIGRSHTGREITKKNRLYVTQVTDIVKAGWTAYYAPLIAEGMPQNPLHVLLVPNSALESGICADATETEKQALVAAFLRWDNYEV